MNKLNKPNKLNITNDFRKKLEGLYSKKSDPINIKEEKEVNIQKNNIHKIIQPQKNVIFKNNNLEEISEISRVIKKNPITITIKVNSYYEIVSYTMIFIFSICLSIRIMYILFLL